MIRRAVPVLLMGLVLLAGLVVVGACARAIAGTAEPTPLPMIDGARLEQDVREVLAHDPDTAALAATAEVRCPPAVAAYPRLALFCQATTAGESLTIPVMILDSDGDYQIGSAF